METPLKFNAGDTPPGVTRAMSRSAQEAADTLNAALNQQREQDVEREKTEEPLPLPVAADAEEAEDDDAEPVLPSAIGSSSITYAGTRMDNPKLRMVIEERCDDVSFDQLLSDGKVRQKVPIVPDKYEVVFQTITGEEDLFVKAQIFAQTGSDGYVMDLYTVMRLALYVYSINGKTLPIYRGKDGKLDPDLFGARWESVADRPEPELEVLSCNARWFHDRTQQMWIVDELKNG